MNIESTITTETADGSQPRSTWRRVGRRALGAGLVTIGVPMLVLPGPGIASIAAGMGILASEYPSIRRGVDRVTKRARR